MKPLQLPGNVDSLSAIGDYVAQVAAEAGLDENAAYGLRLAVDEIATNVVVHGYQQADQAGELIVSACLEDEKITLLLEDESPPYDPRQTPPPDNLDQTPEERPLGGLGVFLALQGVDAYHYEYVDGRNRHTFMMNRTG
jgi:anti-sigma regulatory factor (Ser/Thr protein kinase)